MHLTTEPSQKLLSGHTQIPRYGAISRKGGSFTRPTSRSSFLIVGNAFLLNVLSASDTSWPCWERFFTQDELYAGRQRGIARKTP